MDMPSIQLFRAELGKMETSLRRFNRQLAREARQSATSLAQVKREMKAINQELDWMGRKQIKLRVELDDQATGKLAAIKQAQQSAGQTAANESKSRTTRFVEGVEKLQESASLLKGVAGSLALVAVGGGVASIASDVLASSRERGLYAARGKSEEQMQQFDQLTREIVTVNPYMKSQDAMALISKSEQISPEHGAEFAKQAAMLGVTTGLNPTDLLRMMETLSRATGVTDAKELADTIQYMNNNVKEFSSKHVDLIASYSKMGVTDSDKPGQQAESKLKTPEQLATLVVEMDKELALSSRPVQQPGVNPVSGQSAIDQSLLQETAEKIANGSTKTVSIHNQTETAYQAAMDANPLLAYQKAQNEARQAMVELGMVVANDVAPVLKGFADLARGLADSLQGMPDWARTGMELALVAGLVVGAAVKFVRFLAGVKEAYETVRGKKAAGSGPETCVCGCAEGKNRMTNKDKTNARKKNKNKKSASKQVTASKSQADAMSKTGRGKGEAPLKTGRGKEKAALETGSGKGVAGTGGLLRKGLRRVPVVGALLGGAEIIQSENKLETAAKVGSEALGGWGGAAAGAAVGAAVGSIVPVVGTAIGGAVGGLIGGMGGSMAGGYLFDQVKSWWQSEPKQTQTNAPKRISAAASTVAATPGGLATPQSSPAARTQQPPRSVSITIPQISIPLHVDGVLQDVPTMLKMLRDPAVGQQIQAIMEKALLDALETRGGVAT